MAPIQDTQLEKVIDEVLKSGDVQALDAFLQWNIVEGTSIKCSQQFLTKLDKLVCRSLDTKDSRSAHLGLAMLCKCGKNLKLPRDCQGLPGLIDQGLLEKMVQWFEKCRQLWIQCGPQWDENLFNLSEDFFDVLMVVHDSCKAEACKITESFLYRVGQLAVDPRIYILIQKEAIRKFNLILDKIPVELTKNTKILTSQEASDIMVKLARQILEGSDYDFQTAQMEALCRMVTPDQRKELADHWFSMEHVASAFVKIRDSEFETDCRKFLNMVNGMQGDRRSVFSYPCLEVYLDKYELLIPSDEKLEEFWIDFNLGSRSISFYFSLADEEAEEGQWETICITEDEVQSYTVTEEGKRHVLRLKLSEMVVVGAVEGSSLTIQFSSSLDILQAARSVYGHSKNKGFVGKTGTSVVETTIRIIMEDSSSQVVPESQLPHGESETITASSAPAQMVTPSTKRISESSTAISSSAGRRVCGARTFSAVMPSDTPAKGKGKPSLEMVRSCDRKSEFYLGEPTKSVKTSSYGTTPTSTIACVMMGQSDTSLQSATSKQASKNKNITEGKAVDMVLAGQGEEHSLEQGFVPDTQPRSGRNTTLNWNKLSVSEMLMMPTQKISSRPKPCSSAHRLSVPVIGPNNQKQLHTVLTQRLQQVLSERIQDPAPQEPPAPQRKMSDVREESKDRGCTDWCASALCAPKEQQFQRNGLAKAKSKGQVSLDVDSAPMNAPTTAFTNKARKEAVPQSIKAEANRALSSKQKRDAEIAGSMVKLISSRYESTAKVAVENAGQSWNPPFLNRPIFNMSWLPTGKREVSEAEILKKSRKKTTATSTRQKKDVFTFSPDAPLSTGGKNKTFMNASGISSSGIGYSSELHSTTKKEQPVAKEKRHVKKHLFSDTDTDYATTDVSWLRESSRKPKPKVIKYPKPIKSKPASPRISYESPDLPPSSQKPEKCESKPKKRKTNVKEGVEQPKKRVKPAAAPAADRRPQRAAAISTKSYKEPDTDDSQSESEMPSVSKAKHTSIDHHAEKKKEVAQVKNKKTASKQPTKNYTKPENNDVIQSESVSELPPPSKKCFVRQRFKNTCSEVPKGKKRKHTSSEQSTDSYSRVDINSQSALKKPSGLKQQRPENVDPEISKLKKTNVSLVQEQTNALKNSWAARQASFSPSPIFSERMRSAERSDPTLGLSCSPLLTPLGSPLPASPDLACQDTPSPILLLPKPCSTVNNKGNFKPSCVYSAEKKHSSSKTQSTESVISLPSLTPVGQTPTGPRAAQMSPVQQSRTSPLPSRLPTLPLLTMLELDKLSMPSPPVSPFPEDSFTHGCHYDFRKMCSESQVSLSLSSIQSSVLSSIAEDSPTAVLAIKKEKSPLSSWDLKPQLHVSGPSLKRCVSSSHKCEGEQKEERKRSKMREQHSPRMKPRKLFKSFAEVSAESEVIQVMSSSDMVSSSHWEAEVGDEDVDKNLELPKADVNPSHLCQQFSSELKKVKDRSKMMEFYSKQSLKTVQQHFSSLNMQVTKYRSQRRKKVQEVLLEEIHKLEQDDTMLKSMEKDLAMYWKKQSMAFHSYKELENRRKETVAKALQSNVCHSLEYEERLFTSQMGLVRKDMKSFQDRLLCQMQEVEILSVKRGLHALFFP